MESRFIFETKNEFLFKKIKVFYTLHPTFKINKIAINTSYNGFNLKLKKEFG